jgi:hypothetical protein
MRRDGMAKRVRKADNAVEESFHVTSFPPELRDAVRDHARDRGQLLRTVYEDAVRSFLLAAERGEELALEPPCTRHSDSDMNLWLPEDLYRGLVAFRDRRGVRKSVAFCCAVRRHLDAVGAGP